MSSGSRSPRATGSGHSRTNSRSQNVSLGLLPSDTPEQPDVNALAEVPTSDTTTLSYEARPGDQMNLINGGAKAIRLKVVTACGTATIYDLHPGGEVQLTVGTSPASVYLLNVDDDYTGLRIVR
jgi:hypothetical protein